MIFYPTIILPRRYYKEMIDVKELFEDLKDFWVSRRGIGDFNKVATQYGGGWKIERDAFGDKIVGYSMNMEGAFFDGRKHVCLRQTGKGSKDWLNKKVIILLLYLFNYKKVQGFPIFYKASLFHDVDIPYEKKVQKAEYDKLNTPAHKHKIIEDKFKTEGLVELKAHTFLKHAPSNLNYWHVQLQTFAANDDTKELDSQSKWRKAIFDYILGILMNRKNIHVKIEHPITIPEKYYLDRKPAIVQRLFARIGICI